MNTPPSELTEDQTIARILKHSKTVAVVGLSPKPQRDSYHVAQYMQSHGWRIVPVNPVVAGQTLLGETVYATLTEATQHVAIDLVDVFRNSDEAGAVVAEAMALKLPAVWLQLGVRNNAAVAQAQAAGLLAVQDRCLMVEHARHVGTER